MSIDPGYKVRNSDKSPRPAEDALRRMRQAGMTLPQHPQRAQSMLTNFQEMTSQPGAFRKAIASYQKGDLQNVGSVEQARKMNRQSSDVAIALDKRREPFQTLTDKGIPWNVQNDEELEKIRLWCRGFYATHHLQPLCVDIYSRFPVQGMEVDVKDPELKAFYEDLFMDGLNYEEFLIDFGREFWTTGEVNALASFNETLGVWDHEEILNPDDVIVEKSPFSKEPHYKLRVPETIRNIIDNTDGRQDPRDMEIIRRYYPEFLNMTRNLNEDEGLSVSNILLSRVVNKASAWDTRGTPHMLRCFRQLMMEESLNAAQDAIADRLYSPLILAKLGSPDLGDGEPWIPDHEELTNFRDDMQMALSADFRFMAYHFGLDIKSVFGRESMPNLSNDYDRIERKQLQVWGIGESLISGSSNGAYASSALNREFVTQLMSSYQKFVKRHFRKRAEVIAEAQEHFDYEISGGVRSAIYEEVYEVDEEGNGHIRKRPKLLIPEIKFLTMNLRDEAQERQFMQTLKNGGVPISDGSLLINVPIEFDQELEKVQEEKVKKIVAEKETLVKAIKVLESKGLPLGDELQKIKDEMEGKKPNAEPSNNSNEDGPDGPREEEEEEQEEASPDAGVPDIGSEPVKTPNVAPVGKPTPPGGRGRSTLPRNQIKQRPEVSDEQRADAPKAANAKRRGKATPIRDQDAKPGPNFGVPTGRFADPSVVGLSAKLLPETVSKAIEERLWVKSLSDDAKERLAAAREALEVGE